MRNESVQIKQRTGRRGSRFLRKGVFALLLASIAGSLTFGAAASLSLTSDDLGSGTAPIESCDAEGINVSWQGVSPFQATLSDVDNRCDGQAYVLTVFLGDDFTSYTGDIPVDAASDVVLIDLRQDGLPLSNQIDQVQLTITGPAA